jgi:hypothetical protein
MRFATKAWTLAAVAVALGVFDVASAQTPPAAPDKAQPEVVARQDVELTPEQMVAEAKKAQPQMDQESSSVRLQLEHARAARDVVKTLCLNDKLNQIDVAVRSAADHVSSLELAAGRKDTDRARHDYAVVQVLRDRVKGLVIEANQCIGEETGFVGESTVKVEIDPTIPEDPSQYPNVPVEGVVANPPQPASPTS